MGEHRKGDVMPSFRLLACLVGIATALVAGDPPAKQSAPPTRALNEAFHGKIVKISGRKVTLFYDFSDPAQLEDFEVARPPRLLDACPNDVRIEDGKLVLGGSSSIRHKIESVTCLNATFKVTPDKLQNVGAVITEPILSDFYVVYNLFDRRFNKSGNMHIAACGLREDEGAEDPANDMVNFRDIFNGRVKDQEPGREYDVEVQKKRWEEFFRVDKTKGKGSSKGKTADLHAYKFGFFVHGCEAKFDDLTLTVELSDEYLEFERLRPEIAKIAPTTGTAKR
jgi:hypothetical protein